MVFWDKWKEKDEVIDSLILTLDSHNERINEIISKIDFLLVSKPENLTKDEQSRLADLEVKMAKLWAILLETTPNGKEKASKFGKRFGGQLR